MPQSCKASIALIVQVASVLTLGITAQAQSAPPAQVDPATPRTQNGLTLLAVTRGDAQGDYAFPIPSDLDFLSGPRSNGPEGGIGLWVRGPKPPPMPPQHGRFRPSPSSARPSASARALNGDTLPAQAETASSYSNSMTGEPVTPLFLVTVPGGYPVGYPAIDVSVSDARGHSARWRLIRLAAPVHAVVSPLAFHDTFAGAGARLSVHAWRDGPTPPTGASSHFYSQEMAGVHYELTARVPPGSNWVVRIFKRQLEWEAVRPAGQQDRMMARFGVRYARRPQALWTASFGPGAASYPMQDMVRTPYAKYNHVLRLSGELVQMATAQESVTFHNLAIRRSAPSPGLYGRMRGQHGYTPPPSYEVSTHPQTVVTPSGISVSLLPLSALGPGYGAFGGYGMGNSIRMLLRFGQAPPSLSSYPQASLVLPRSPLYRKYHKPITYTLQAPPPYFLEPLFGSMGFQSPGGPIQMLANLRLPYSPPIRTVQNGRTMFRMALSVVPTRLDHLTLIVLQRAELRALPISFVVPIGDQAPVRVPPPGTRMRLPGRPGSLR